MNPLRWLARWVLRRELEVLRRELAGVGENRETWKRYAIAQEIYREEVHGEGVHAARFRDWYLAHVRRPRR